MRLPPWHAHPDVWLLVLVLEGVYLWALSRLRPEPVTGAEHLEEAVTRRQIVWYTLGVAAIWAGWHAPLFFMPEFGSSPIEALATVAVTFWYAWLFNHAAGSSLLTLIAHATEGTIETSTLWPGAPPAPSSSACCER